MAKSQTFGDKVKKQKGKDLINAKVLTWKKDEKRGTLRFHEIFVKVKDINELNTIDV